MEIINKIKRFFNPSFKDWIENTDKELDKCVSSEVSD